MCVVVAPTAWSLLLKGLYHWQASVLLCGRQKFSTFLRNLEVHSLHFIVWVLYSTIFSGIILMWKWTDRMKIQAEFSARKRCSDELSDRRAAAHLKVWSAPSICCVYFPCCRKNNLSIIALGFCLAYVWVSALARKAAWNVLCNKSKHLPEMHILYNSKYHFSCLQVYMLCGSSVLLKWRPVYQIFLRCLLSQIYHSWQNSDNR